MPDTPYQKIEAGLHDAIAYGKGDRSRGRRHRVPVNEVDRQARAAIAAYARWRAKELRETTPLLDMNPRTLQRIVAGKRDVPPRAAREVSAKIRHDMVTATNRAELEDWATAMDRWAQECEDRQRPNRIDFENGCSIEFRGADDEPLRSMTGGGWHG